MDDFQSETDSDYTSYWRDWFISSRGNEYFCEIDEEYLTDRFNLTGLNTEVHYYQHALDLITDVFDLDCEDDMREAIEKSARHLYGLVHARYIVTTRGLAKMVDKYKKCDFGRCPRVMCEGQALLPMGQSDLAGQKAVRLYCARCEDLYNPKSSKHASIDGAYFGTSFHSMLFQVYPALIPTKSRRRYEPKIFGFKVHAAAALGRWQDEFRRSERLKLMEAGVGVSDVPVEYVSGNAGASGGAGVGAGTGASAGSGVSAGAAAGAGVNTNSNTNTSDAEAKSTMKVQKLFVEDEESDDGMGEVEEEAREKKRVAERRAAALAALVAAQREKQTQHSGPQGGQSGQGHGNGGGQARGVDVEDLMDDGK